MSLAQHLLYWPQPVARQVVQALLLPASDMHASQARQAVPQPLWGLAPALLSKALLQGPAGQWARELDARQLSHRLALLPSAVVAQVAWNLGLLLHAQRLRQVILRPELALLAQGGVDHAAWVLVDAAPATQPHTDGPADLRALPVAQWPERLRRSGEQALAALASATSPALGQRLRWKLAGRPNEDAAEAAPTERLLQLAYAPAAHAWSPDWEPCLLGWQPPQAAAKARP